MTMTSEERTAWRYMNTVLTEYQAGKASYQSYIDAWDWWEEVCAKAGHLASAVATSKKMESRK